MEGNKNSEVCVRKPVSGSHNALKISETGQSRACIIKMYSRFCCSDNKPLSVMVPFIISSNIAV